MTREHPFDETVTTAEEFETVLGHLPVAAARNDIDPPSSSVCRNDDTHPDWEVMVFELDTAEGFD
jgi:hypothetical protein